MRWNIKPKKYYRHGDMRIIRKFLFLPKKINDEIRWLEFAEIKQMYQIGYCGDNWWQDLDWHEDDFNIIYHSWDDTEQ